MLPAVERSGTMPWRLRSSGTIAIPSRSEREIDLGFSGSPRSRRS
jgi:hypothetical protein